jgi:hypothetical protein
MMSNTKFRIGRHRTARIAAVLLGAIFVCAALPAAAEEDLLDLGGAQPLPNSSLLSMRGGFMIGGFDISFGVTIKATIDGATELKTSFNILNANQIGNESVSLSQNGNVVFSQGGANANAGTKAASVPLANLQGGNQSGQNNVLPNGSVLATANGLSLVKLQDGGFALTSVDTTIIQSINDHSIVSEVSNTASNTQIQTSLTADLFFNNFAQMAGRSDMNSLMTHMMAEQMNAGMLGP